MSLFAECPGCGGSPPGGAVWKCSDCRRIFCDACRKPGCVFAYCPACEGDRVYIVGRLPEGVKAEHAGSRHPGGDSWPWDA